MSIQTPPNAHNTSRIKQFIVECFCNLPQFGVVLAWMSFRCDDQFYAFKERGLIHIDVWDLDTEWFSRFIGKSNDLLMNGSKLLLIALHDLQAAFYTCHRRGRVAREAPTRFFRPQSLVCAMPETTYQDRNSRHHEFDLVHNWVGDWQSMRSNRSSALSERLSSSRTTETSLKSAHQKESLDICRHSVYEQSR